MNHSVTRRGRRFRFPIAALAWSGAITLLLVRSLNAGPISVYYNDFDSGAIVRPGVTTALSGVTTTESVQGYAGIGPGTNTFAGSFLRNDTPSRPGTPPHKPPASEPALKTTLTLTGLPAHTGINVVDPKNWTT